jgi:hypothetical protein
VEGWSGRGRRRAGRQLPPGFAPHPRQRAIKDGIDPRGAAVGAAARPAPARGRRHRRRRRSARAPPIAPPPPSPHPPTNPPASDCRPTTAAATAGPDIGPHGGAGARCRPPGARPPTRARSEGRERE